MPKAFVIMPFKEPFDSVYAEVIRPVLEDAGIQADRADQPSRSIDIVDELKEQILASALIIVEASLPNPNVYYEFGFAAAHGKELLIIAQKGSDLPFDTRQIRHLLYEKDDHGALRSSLSRWVASTSAARGVKKRVQSKTLKRGEVFPGFFDAALLVEQFSFSKETLLLKDIRQGDILACAHSYSTDLGAESWLRLCADPLYTPFFDSMTYLQENVTDIIGAFPPAMFQSSPDFISLGPGNGYKDRTMLRGIASTLNDKGIADAIYYYPLDISPRILANAIENVATAFRSEGALRVKALLGDFEKLKVFAPVYDFRPEPNVFSFLGNTVGNVAHDLELLRKIYGAMHRNDILLLEVRTKQAKLQLKGDQESQFALSFAPLRRLGVPFEREKLRVREEGLSQIPGTRSLVVHYDDFTVMGEEVDDLLLSCVNFYDIAELSAVLAGRSLGFKVLKVFEARSMALFVLEK